MHDIKAIAAKFPIEGVPAEYTQIKSGHINETYLVTTDKGVKYILQWINQYVFPNVNALMNNMSAISSFLRATGDGEMAMISYIDTIEGKNYYDDGEGGAWRIYKFVDNSVCHMRAESPEDFYQSALAFGRFQEMLADYPADTLFEIIPNFHNTIDRYEKFKESVKIDGVARVEEVEEDIAFLMEREALGSTLQKMLDAGILPLRVTHNDTKLNNVLLDKATRKSLCVLDLDTVMPGLSLYDFGDSIRFGAATAEEDEKDLSKMKLDLHLFQVYTRGFLEAAPSLTAMEVALLPLGAIVMTLELAVRFMTDYLDGDLYFKIAYPDHNLVRARTQMALVADMQDKWAEMNRIVAEEAARMGWKI